MAEVFLQRRVTKFLVQLTRDNIATPEVIDNMTGDELEKKFIEWIQK